MKQIKNKTFEALHVLGLLAQDLENLDSMSLFMKQTNCLINSSQSPLLIYTF